MQLNNLVPRTQNKKVMIVGRGGKRGKTSGRGGKGQTARAGNKRRPELRDFIKRIPKLRGRGVSPHKSIETRPIAINVGVINDTSAVKSGAEISPKTLIEFKIISTIEGKIPTIKILSGGEISKKITIVGCKVSASAKEKIEKAGGSVK